jgi:hypothetical protein
LADDDFEEVVVMVSAAFVPQRYREVFWSVKYSLYEDDETGQLLKKIDLEGVNEHKLEDIGNLANLIAYLQEQLDSVPAEHRNDIIFHFDYDYEGGCDIGAYYYQPATEEEIFEAKNLRKIDEQREEARQRKEYERLKIKFAD